jgi:branched-chain amino acid transport system permease protein
LSFTEFMQLVVSGVVLGALYGLIAVGYTLVYGVLQLINFAHGEIFMLGGFGALFVYAWVPAVQHLSVWLALPLLMTCGVMVSVAAGLAAERLAYRPLRRAGRLAPLITAIGLSIVLQQLVFLFYPVKTTSGAASWGASQEQVFPELLDGTFHIGGVVLQQADILILVMGAVCMTWLAWFVGRTRTGRAMQATAQDPDCARLMGIDTDKMIMVAFVVGSALAGVAAVCQGLKYNNITFDMGFIAGLKAFTAAVLGGIGNIYGAMVGGLALGVVQSLAAGGLSFVPGMHVFGGSAWSDVWAFVILILVLLVRPQGLLGERVADRA